MVAPAIIAGGASLLSGLIGGKGAKSAAKAQAAAQQQAIAEQRRQYDQSRSDFMPFLNAGTTALGGDDGLMTLLGLNGNDAQGSAIARLKDSPAFTSRYGLGVDTILQNSAATGGLRGGNTQNSLAQFSSGLLADVIRDQLGNLGGLAQIGSGTANSLSNLGQSSAGNISNLLTAQGNTKAGGILGQATAFGRTLNDIGSIWQENDFRNQIFKLLGNRGGIPNTHGNSLGSAW